MAESTTRKGGAADIAEEVAPARGGTVRVSK